MDPRRWVSARRADKCTADGRAEKSVGGGNSGLSYSVDRDMSDSVGGQSLFRAASRPSRRYRAGRTCAELGCRTQLSIYNSGKHCALHAPMLVPRTRGRKIA